MKSAGMRVLWVLLMGAVIGGPAIAQPYCFETILNLSAPSNADGITRVEYEWSSSINSGFAGGANLRSLRMKLWNGGSLLYNDNAMVNGNPQPLGGAARTAADIGWDFNLNFQNDVPILSQMLNARDVTLAASAGVQYQVADGATLPSDGQVWIKKATGGATDWLDIEQLASQLTRPDFNCDGVGDPPTATTTTVASSPKPSSIGQSVTITGTVTSGQGTPDGQISFFADNAFIGFSLMNASGEASFNHTFNSWGNHTVRAQYEGTFRYQDGTSPSQGHWVLVPTTTTLVPSAFIFPEQTNVTLTATVDFEDDGFPEGTVTFKNGNATIGSAVLSSGQGSITTGFPGGNHTLTAVYGGSAFDEPSMSAPVNVTARFATATALATSPNPSNLGELVDLTATVTSTGGTPTGTVEFRDGGTSIGQVALTGGQAVLQTDALPEGNRTLSAHFQAGGLWRASDSDTLVQQVLGSGIATTATITSSPNPSTLGQSVDITVTVTSGQGVPTGDVLFRNNGELIAVLPLSDGQATYSTSFLGGGERSLSGHYVGQGDFLPADSAPTAHLVLAVDSVVTVNSVPNTTGVGESVHFNAFINPANKSARTHDDPRGEVTFKNGNTILGTVPVGNGNVASLQTTALPIGQHQIRAEFGGSPSFNPSTSAPYLHTVLDESRTAIQATPNPGLVDGPISLTATVLSNSGTPTGQVGFVIQSVGTVNATLDGNGQATVTTSIPAAGSRFVRAVYSGDGNRAGSQSELLEIAAIEPQIQVYAVALPDRGLAPLNGVRFSALTVGQGVGPITFTLYCNRADAGTNVTPGFARQVVVEGTSIEEQDVCNYPLPGTYTAKVIAERNGIASEARWPVTATARPVPDFSFLPSAPFKGATVNFTDQSTGADTWAWDFNADGLTDSSLRNPSRTYTRAGTYPVSLTVSNAYATVTTTQIVLVRDDTPFISTLTRKYPGFMISGAEFDNPYTIGVDWQGAPPGSVRVRSLNATSVPGGLIPTGGSSATYNLDMGDVPSRTSRTLLEFTPISAGGTEGSKSYDSLYKFPYPSWLNVALSVGGGSFSLAVPPAGGVVEANLAFDFPSPHLGPAGVPIPKSIPLIGGNCGLSETFATISAKIKSSGTGSLGVSGQTGLECAKRFVQGRIRGSGDFTLGYGGGLKLTRATFGLGVTAGIKVSKKIEDALPSLKNAYGWPIIGDEVRGIGKSSISAEVSAGVDVDAVFEQNRNDDLKFRSATGKLTLQAKGKLHVGPILAGRLEVDVYGSVTGTVTIGLPDSPLIRTASITIEIGAKATIHIFFLPNINVAAKIGCTWTNPGEISCPVTISGGVEFKDADDLQLVMFVPDYKSFGEYSRFAPSRVASAKAGNLPEVTRTTSLVTNVQPGATPHLTELPGGDLLLMWMHQDLADPTLQGLELAWSRFDGTSWSAPALIADDTRWESQPTAALDDQGRLVAAWQRIKDPAFTTPLTSINDLPLFDSQFEVVTATFDPATNGWGPVTALTDDAGFDGDLQLSRTPGGDLLLTWISNSGDNWTSTAADPSTIRYALWDSATGAFGPSGVVASGLAGVSEHVAAYRGDAGVVMLSRDPDPLVDDDHVIDYWLWDGVAWAGPTTFASGGFGHKNPQVQYDSAGTAHVVWLAGAEEVVEEAAGPETRVFSRLVEATLGDPTPQLLRDESDSTSLRDVQFLSNTDGNLTLIWQEASPDGPAEVFARIYDDEAAMWSEDRMLTDDPEREANAVSAIYGSDGVLRAAYLSTVISRTSEVVNQGGQMVEFSEIPVREETDLRFFAHSLIRDLSVVADDVRLSPENPDEGDTVTVDAVVRNTGDLAMGDFTVGVFVGDPDVDGVLVGSQVVTGPLCAGLGHELQFAFSYPVGGGDVYVVIDPDDQVAELTRLNNRVGVMVTNQAPDAIALADIVTGSSPLAIAFDGLASTDPEGDALTYVWIFGDGTESVDAAQVLHTFDVPGEYRVTLAVTDVHGNQSTDTLTVSVGPLAAGETTDVLGVDKQDDDTVVLTWGESCRASDSDYAVYVGALGDFASHLPLTCSTGGATETAAQTAAGDQYFLAVPRTTISEGAYGFASDGTPRPASTAACAPQLLGTCSTACTPLSQWASSAFASSEYSAAEWSAAQATGVPDTNVCGDLPTAWAPLDAQDNPEWLEVQYATPVLATGVDIYETFATGGVYLIEARDVGGILHEVWTGADTTPCSGVLSATWTETPYLVSAIRIHLQIPDYEEIDAVELHGASCD